jgi:hypothetical protein
LAPLPSMPTWNRSIASRLRSNCPRCWPRFICEATVVTCSSDLAQVRSIATPAR